MIGTKLNIAGWGTKEFDEKEFEDYLCLAKPKIIEISKDFADNGISLKKLKKILGGYLSKNKSSMVSFAGTTDFITCAGMPFDEYLSYLKIQIAQAKFLKSSFFRVLVGGQIGKKINRNKIFSRLKKMEQLASPMKLVIEIHNGFESDPEIIKYLIGKTKYLFLVDFQNLIKSRLSYGMLSSVLPKKRIAYFHFRNIEGKYSEHRESAQEEKIWRKNCIGMEFLWEPKKISSKKIKDIFYEYQNSDREHRSRS